MRSVFFSAKQTTDLKKMTSLSSATKLFSAVTKPSIRDYLQQSQSLNKPVMSAVDKFKEKFKVSTLNDQEFKGTLESKRHESDLSLFSLLEHPDTNTNLNSFVPEI
jgi:hypothetical protein